MSKKKLTPRQNFIENSSWRDVRAKAWDALMMASSHDPDHHKWLTQITNVLNKDLKEIESRLDIIEHQLRRIGAPQYRRVKHGIFAEIIRGPKSAKKVKDYTL